MCKGPGRKWLATGRAAELQAGHQAATPAWRLPALGGGIACSRAPPGGDVEGGQAVEERNPHPLAVFGKEPPSAPKPVAQGYLRVPVLSGGICGSALGDPNPWAQHLYPACRWLPPGPVLRFQGPFSLSPPTLRSPRACGQSHIGSWHRSSYITKAVLAPLGTRGDVHDE